MVVAVVFVEVADEARYGGVVIVVFFRCQSADDKIAVAKASNQRNLSGPKSSS